jgi:8-oxo-dGTP pyrophosphatase MutT (NUDIX family)
MTAPVHASPAATVVLARSGAAPVEVLLMRRHADLAFLAGAYVFPGGRVDEEDALDPALAPRHGAPRIPGLDVEGETTLRVAAIRELVEEAGILLARRTGAWATDAEAEAMRAALVDGAAFGDVVAEGGWVLATEALAPFGWIVTPRDQPKRFDTHFLLARMPDAQEATHDGSEADDVVWIDPAAAVEPGDGEPLAIAPPTWFTLALLAQHRTIDELWAWASSREIEQIEPILVVDGDGRQVTFPNDPLLARWHGDEGIVFRNGRVSSGPRDWAGL